MTSVAEEFGINKSIVSGAWKALQTIGTAVRNVAGPGKPLLLMTTAAVDEQYIVLQVKRARYQSARAIF